MKLKNLALIGAGCLYVVTGYATFELTASLTGDSELANQIVLVLALPLGLPLLKTLGWIERHW